MNERDPQTYAIIGAAMEVHRELGPGFLEAPYGEALAVEFRARSIPFQAEVELPIMYKGHRLCTFYRADFVVFGSIIVEIKALKDLSDSERSQVLNYLKATGCQRGLLINFGARTLQYERLVHQYVPQSGMPA